ncbi:MAG: adenylyltransferase/cytidyltransferase family protein [Thermoplasmata archaeon]|nr:adenylyltransferase/cytidyltransferase family protein [Thermoplasmata archaeon]
MSSDEKIISLNDLAKICGEYKIKKKKVVLSRGCFDLLHPGHIRHLKAAKKYGDILIVTIIPDRFVRKGPERPVFNEHLRAESVASLADVDYVALEKDETVVNTIQLLKPDFYVKGKEYSNSTEGETSTILLEEKAVKKIGGEIRFTDEITFSSSSIINERFNILSKDAKEYLKTLKRDYTSSDIVRILKSLNNMNVLIIGDVILDEYVFCKAVGKPEKAAVVSTKFLYNEVYAGGCLAVANHVAGFVKNVQLVSCLGNDNKEEYIKKHLRDNIRSKFFYRKYAPTIVKTRYLEKFERSKLFEVSQINDEFIDQKVEESVISYLNNNIPKYDMVLVADFGHGLITPKIQETISKKSKFTAVNAQTNSINFGFNMITKYSNVDYISIDERELRLPYRAKFGEIEPLIRRVAKDTQCKRINITLGGSGSIYYQDGKTYYVPIFSDRVVDSVGAGDAVLAITSLLAKKKAPPKVIPFVGNVVGGLKVKTMGNKEPINPSDLFTFINYVMK